MVKHDNIRSKNTNDKTFIVCTKFFVPPDIFLHKKEIVHYDGNSAIVHLTKNNEYNEIEIIDTRLIELALRRKWLRPKSSLMMTVSNHFKSFMNKIGG